MHKEEPKINCSTFQKKEQIISDITNKINLAKEVQEKARFAQDLQIEADELLSCQGYDNKKIDCRSCHFIANLCKKTAHLIIKAKKLKQ